MIDHRYREELDKRAGAKAPSITTPITDDPWEPIKPREPFSRSTEILVVGAGFAGMILGAQLTQVGHSDFMIVDQAGDFGGTWYWNRYPGAQCDVESYIYYPLLEETGYVPSSRYPMAHETLDYCRHFGRHFSLYDRAVFHTGAIRAAWDDKNEEWVVETNRGDEIRARFLIRSNGAFGAPALPQISGMDTFTGTAFHSSRWDYNYTGGSPENPVLDKLVDKTVAVVGSGASAVQIIPALVGQAKHVYAVQRTPGPAVGERDTTPTDPEWFTAQPAGWQRERILTYDLNTSGFLQPHDEVQDNFTVHARRLLTADNPQDEDAAIMGEIRDLIDAQVTDPATADALKPFYSRRCKRVTFDNGYYEAFNDESITLIDAPSTGLSHIQGTTLHAGDRTFDADCIIFATGFDTTGNPLTRTGFDVRGRGDERLTDHYANGLQTLHGAMADGFPNHFQIGTGQNALTANNTSGLTTQAEHILDIIAETKRRGAITVEPTAEATETWATTVRERGEGVRAAFETCVPGYYTGYEHGDGAYTNQLFPEGITVFRKLLDAWRAEGSYAGLRFS
ncbi:NAD(P)/FAD-dependent oxidoreductase [Corynebacterium sp. Q4381]|uniref:flavin-containing monooxygenase n=1 Tax=Corynebacterium sp. Marseille-Q4381 TaxID=3121597 RepID=UPI002FE687C8